MSLTKLEVEGVPFAPQVTKVVPPLDVWVVIYHHKHGTDAWPVTCEMSEEEVIKHLREEGEWCEEDDKDELTFIEIRGPWSLVAQDPKEDK